MNYKDKFTLDGRVKPVAGVTRAKVQHVQKLVEAALKGSHSAVGTLKESLTTSDAIFNFAHVVQLNLLPQYDEAERTWRLIAGTRGASDFRPQALYSILGQWQDGVLGDGTPRHVAPVIPEGVAYPYAYMAGEESQNARIQKRGFKTDFTMESFVNDTVGFIQALPGEMLQVALDTEEYEVYSALLNGAGTDQQLDAGTIPDGTSVPANASLDRAALILAKSQLANREINGRKIRVTGGYNLIVPVGQTDYVQFILNNVSLSRINQGDLRFEVTGYNPLGDLTIVESEYVTGTQWYLVPKPGATRRPTLERLSLIGHEAPELRVENATGNYIGGGQVSPFEGSFDNDSATFRLRTFGTGVLWTPDQVVWSTGAGGPSTPPTA